MIALFKALIWLYNTYYRFITTKNLNKKKLHFYINFDLE